MDILKPYYFFTGIGTLIMTQEYKEPFELSNDELIKALTKRYQPTKIPPCNICGDPLSIGSIGGGKPTIWVCSGRKYDNAGNWMGYKEGRKPVDEHYSKSRYEDRRQGGDELVMELIKRFENR